MCAPCSLWTQCCSCGGSGAILNRCLNGIRFCSICPVWVQRWPQLCALKGCFLSSRFTSKVQTMVIAVCAEQSATICTPNDQLGPPGGNRKHSSMIVRRIYIRFLNNSVVCWSIQWIFFCCCFYPKVLSIIYTLKTWHGFGHEGWTSIKERHCSPWEVQSVAGSSTGVTQHESLLLVCMSNYWLTF